MTTATLALAPACQVKADWVKAHAAAHGMTGRVLEPFSIQWRLIWDGPAAGEYPRPMLQDAADYETTFGPGYMADLIWHHAAGACVIGPHCTCGPPAFHRDALGAIGKEIREAIR